MSSAPVNPPVDRDEANRIWQHGLHEDSLYQGRLASFTLIESILLGFLGNIYGKPGTDPFCWYVAIFALLFSIIWLFIQFRHWAYLAHVTRRVQQFVPEYKATLSSFSSHWLFRFDTPRLLALAIPALFVVVWVFLLGWMLLRPSDEVQSKFGISLDRLLISILIALGIWFFLRLRKIEKLLLTPNLTTKTVHSATPVISIAATSEPRTAEGPQPGPAPVEPPHGLDINSTSAVES